MSKKNQNYTNRKQNRFQPERMRGNVFVNNSGKQWLPGENGRAAKVERLLRGVKEEKKEIAGNMARYKDSGVEWIGAIPKGWKVKRLKYALTSIRNGASDAAVEYSPELPRYVRITDIDDNGHLKQTGKQYLPKELAKNFILDKKAVLIARVGNLGKTMLFDPDKENEVCALSGYLIEAITNPKVMNSKFLFYFIKSSAYMDWANRNFVQTTIQNLSAGRHKNLPVTLPPLPEQQRIADFLDTKCSILDRTIDAVSRQIEDLEKYKKALITKTVTKGICKKGEPERAMKDSGVEWIGKVPEEWSVKRLKYVLDSIRNGASAASYEYEPDSFRYVRITDIDDNGNLKQTGKQYLPKEMAKNFILNKKAVLIANTGSLGKAMLFDPDKEDEVCALNGHLIEAIANPNIISNEYLYFFIKSYNYINWVNRSYVQTTMQMLSAGRHKNLPVTVPPLTEQQQIADYLDEKCKNIDNRVQKRRQQLEWLKEYKKSLIFDYVTGKKRV